ncbi:MAG: hypothetical protein ACOVNR_09655, partial [Chitinophagaceae bacterium]
SIMELEEMAIADFIFNLAKHFKSLFKIYHTSLPCFFLAATAFFCRNLPISIASIALLCIKICKKSS